MARKVFISVLGAGPYSECTYIRDSFEFSTRYIQIATLKYFIEESKNNDEWTDKDCAIFFLTQKAEDDQWNVGKSTINDGGKNKVVNLTGLKDELSNQHWPIEIKTQHIDDGQDEKEIWSIFKTIYDEIGIEDELYFDITHAFRYLPMLLLTLINYSKFLKNVKLKSITYGNFMAKEDKKPIMDLTSISMLQDWTYAAGDYLNNGCVDSLTSLCKDEIKPILIETKGKDVAAGNLNRFVKLLQSVVDSFRTCRGIQIINATDLSKLKDAANKLDSTMIEPLNPIFDKIKESLVYFDEKKNLKNAYSAAKWCFENKLYQQSATILQESVVSFICKRNDIDIADEKLRECVNSAFFIKHNDIDESDWRVKEENKEIIKKILRDELLDNSDLLKLFSTMTIVRNDYNHSGMRKDNPKDPSSIVSNIEKCLNGFSKILFNNKKDIIMAQKKTTKTNTEIEKEKIKRFRIWQELLVKTGGVTYKELWDKLEGDVEYDLLRQDRGEIFRLLKSNGIKLEETGPQKGKKFFVETDDFDLVSLYLKSKVAQPYVAILDMLSKSKGLLPESFLKSLCAKYQQMSENVNVDKSISFESDYDSMSELDVFPVIYNALNKRAIWISFHPANKPDENKEGVFSPEYLKQYRSNWYAFGMFEEEGKEPVFQKIPLCFVDNYNDEDDDSLKFQKSHIDDYDEYFDDIIGVENSENNEVETIKFRISNRMFQRLKNKPLHPTQSTCKELDIKGFKGMKINVKYNIELMRVILNLGPDIEIVEPAHIRKRVVKNLQKTMKLYD